MGKMMFHETFAVYFVSQDTGDIDMLWGMHGALFEGTT